MKDAIRCGSDESVSFPNPADEQRLNLTRMRDEAIASRDYHRASICDKALDGDSEAVEFLQMMLEEEDGEGSRGGDDSGR